MPGSDSIVHFCVSLGAVDRYAAALLLIKFLEYLLMSWSAAFLMEAVCIRASLATKFENANTITTPLIASANST